MMNYYNKTSLQENYHSFLEQGVFTEEQLKRFTLNQQVDNGFLIRCSSGTTGRPILIPRSISDIDNIAQRILKSYMDTYGKLPKYTVMMGGISHTQAALKYKHRDTSIISLTIDERDKLNDINPELLLCYPSIARELITDEKLSLSNLKAIKLGGEPTFESDVTNLFKRFKKMLIIEQYGSTELPAVAIRTIHDANNIPAFVLQSERFEFLINDTEGWQPIIAKDCFPELVLQMNNFYDTGDEGYFKKGKLINVRRHGIRYLDDAVNNLLKNGCINLQIDRKKKTIYFESYIEQPAEWLADGKNYKLVRAPLKRLPDSNKMPLLLS